MSTRLDKLLALSGERSRKQAADLIRGGCVRVNGAVIRDPSAKANDGDAVTLNGAPVDGEEMQYYMLHKPSGILTAAEDKRAVTVMDIVPKALSNRKVMPVGRLDKDTTGLLILTNDGVLAHRLLDPKRGVWKTYCAEVTGVLDEADVQAFEQGIRLKDFTAMPAHLKIMAVNESGSRAEVRVGEGKFHQVKRMFSACEHEVTALHRASFGPLVLGELPVGQCRALSADEVQSLKQAAGMNETELLQDE